jgi:uncharacterized protein
VIPLLALASGLIFGIGLVVSGMANPDKVLGFLTLDRHWDPTLAFVMGSALAVTLPGFYWLRRRGKSLLNLPLSQPTARQLDRPLLLGAGLFGLGWGLIGYCPGPGIVAAGLGQWPALVFVAAMLAGAWLAKPTTR